MSRSILIDDTDPTITYTGPWFTNVGSFDETGNSGPPLGNTLHGTNSAASLSYDFSGISITVVGTNQFSTNVSTSVSWQCFVDNESIPVISIAPPPANRVPFCKQDGLTDGKHTIVVNATVSNQQTFYFDYLEYIPSANAPLDQGSIAVNWTDPQLIFLGNWSHLPEGPSTIQDGATVSFPFTGTSLSWFGFYANNTPFAFTTASYSIDGEGFIDFPLNAESPLPRNNQLFFQTASLPSGQHNISLIYHGNPFTTPLTLESLVIQNAAANTSNSSTNSTTNGSSSTPLGTAASGHKSRKTGAIAGGVVGGVVAILGIFFFLFVWHRKRATNKEKTKSEDSEKYIHPFNPTEINPTVAVDSKSIMQGTPTSSDSIGLNPSLSLEAIPHALPSLSPLRYQNTPNPIVSSATASNSDAATDSRGQTLPEPTSNLMVSSPLSSSTGPGSKSVLADSGGVPSANTGSPDPSPVTDTTFSPQTRSYLASDRVVVHEEDSGIRLTSVDQHGNPVEVLPPMYTSG